MELPSVDVKSFGEIGERAIGHRHVDEHRQVETVGTSRKAWRLDARAPGLGLKEWLVEGEQIMPEEQVDVRELRFQGAQCRIKRSLGFDSDYFWH
jgi:hypothetical protein